MYQRLIPKSNIDIIHLWNQLSFEKLITTFWTKFGIQYAPSPTKLQIKLFFLKVIPVPDHSKEYQCVIPTPKILISVPATKYWKYDFSFLFPFPKVGDAIFHSHSRYQNLGMGWVIPVPIPKIQKVIPVHPNVAKNAKNYHKLHKFLKVAQSCHKLQIGFKSCQ